MGDMQTAERLTEDRENHAVQFRKCVDEEKVDADRTEKSHADSRSQDKEEKSVLPVRKIRNISTSFRGILTESWRVFGIFGIQLEILP